jgi:hypothetical protein
VYGAEYRPIDVPSELAARGLFEPRGQAMTVPVSFTQTVDGYIESFHARAGLPRAKMTPEAADAFDAAVRRLVEAHVTDRVELTITAQVTWGEPLAPRPADASDMMQ